MNSVNMGSLSWVEYQQRVQNDNPVIFIPCGALEQHGPHLPLGTDALLASAIANSVATEVNGIVAPTLNYGYRPQLKSGGGWKFPGTVSLDGNHLTSITRDVIKEFARHGVQNVVLVDGHYENQWFLTEGIDLALRDLGTPSNFRVMRFEYWDFLSEATLNQAFPNGFPGFALEHAAVMETSLMLHYHTDLVKLDQIPDVQPAEFPPYDIFPPHNHWIPPSGVLSSAKSASAETGALMAIQLTESIANAIKHEFDG